MDGIRSLYDAPRSPVHVPSRAENGTAPPDAAPRQALGTSGPGEPSVHAHASPPAGTDPELWQVLTSAERSHVAKLGSMGPLTYGRMHSGHTPAMTPVERGIRLDVKA